MQTKFNEDEFHDYVVSHGLGPPTPKGYEVGKWLIETGDDYATAAHEVVARGLTEEEEE